jgi:[ribosomal protein S5]-alanine N-acetyltransferase
MQRNPLRRARLPLTTPRLILRLPAPQDVPELRQSFRDSRTARAVGAPLHSREETRNPGLMVARTLREYRKGEHLSLSVVDRQTRRCIGRVGLRGLVWPYQKVESLSYWIDPRSWNRGYATEASYFLCREAFLRLRIRRIGSQALDRNTASLRVLEKLGFVEEGRERRAVCVKGVCMDMILFGLLKEEMVPESTISAPWRNARPSS